MFLLVFDDARRELAHFQQTIFLKTFHQISHPTDTVIVNSKYKNHTEFAAELGMSRTTLWRRLKFFNYKPLYGSLLHPQEQERIKALLKESENLALLDRRVKQNETVETK